MSSLAKGIIILTLSAGTGALACTPDPDFAYDDISSQNMLLATARLKLFETERSESEFCWKAEYEDAQYFYGTGAEGFFVETCFEGVFSEEEMGADPALLDLYGFKTGANVALGLVLDPDAPAVLRYAIPTCWGWFHVNLDEFTDKERGEFLEDLKSQVEHAN